MLVKELQGLGLRVDLVDDEAAVDAEHVIASSGPEDKTVPLMTRKKKHTWTNQMTSVKLTMV